MRQAVLWVAVFFLLGTVAGCGTDPYVQTIDGIIGQMGSAKSKMESMASKLQSLAKKAEKDKDDKKITPKMVNEAFKEVSQEMRKIGERMVALKSDAERLQADLDPERKDELKERHSGRVKDEIDGLNQAYRELQDAIASVDRFATDEAKKDVREQIEAAMQEFASIARQK